MSGSFRFLLGLCNFPRNISPKAKSIYPGILFTESVADSSTLPRHSLLSSSSSPPSSDHHLVLGVSQSTQTPADDCYLPLKHQGRSIYEGIIGSGGPGEGSPVSARDADGGGEYKARPCRQGFCRRWCSILHLLDLRKQSAIRLVSLSISINESRVLFDFLSQISR